MKHLILTACVAVLCAATGVQAQTVACDECHDYVTLTGDLDYNRTLYADTSYLLVDCYVVKDNYTLTIQPGTRIFGDAASKGMLIVERGGTLTANGTDNNPIIFTSCREQGDREPGDWGGIAIFGNATNNVSGGEISVSRCSTPYIGGNATTFDDADNSGSLQYVQIHYAGGGVSGDQAVNGLTLISVGSETVLEYVQVTHSLTNGFSYMGGIVNGKFLAGYNNIQHDYAMDMGYSGKMQFGLSLRTDPLFHNVAGSAGIVSGNEDFMPGSTPRTTSILSNFTLFGPDYCDESELDEDIHNGILLRNNTAGSVYNTVVAGWPTGFQIQDATTIANANDSGFIIFSYNTFYNNVRDIFNTPSWTVTGCENTMATWVNISGTGDPFCAQEMNQENPVILGYNENICDDYCSERPDFNLSGESDLDIGLDDLGDPFFTSVEYRGAFDDNDWTIDWTDWCPSSTNYCPQAMQRSGKADNTGHLQIAPNPATGTAYALFDAGQTGKVIISVLDKVSGQPLRTTYGHADNAGTQRFAIPVNGLQPGVYVVKVVLPDGSVLAGQLFVL